MMNHQKRKQTSKERRAHRVRSRIQGTSERPRFCVSRTLNHISVQLINDRDGMTLGFADDRDLKGKKTEKAVEVGKRIAAIAKEKKIASVLFDRGPYRYHGRVKALADSAREAGLKI